MKKFLLLAITVLIATGLSIQQTFAQDKTKEQKEKEEKLQQAIEIQKKAAEEQKKALVNQEVELDKSLQEANDELDKTNKAFDVFTRVRPPRISRAHTNPEIYVSQGSDWGGNPFFYHSGEDGERTTWDFSKYVKEASFSKQYSFDVEKTAESVVMSIMGDCKSGEIRVKIIMPGGKTFSDILIDESGNLNWRKSFTISEDQNKDKAGEWLFKIDATKATGSFRISLQTY